MFGEMCRTLKVLLKYVLVASATLMMLSGLKQRIARSQLDNSELISVKSIQIGRIVPCNLTVVSVYFKLNRSKYLFDSYGRWQRYFFRSISTTPIVVYTDKKSLSSLLEASLYTSNPKTFYVFENIWSIMSLIEADRNKRPGEYTHNYKEKQKLLDPEARLHNAELYAIWNCKSYLLKRSSSGPHNLYESKFFIYSDIGAFRGRFFPKWPDADYVDELGDRIKDRILLSQISAESAQSEMTDHTVGGFIAGSPEALLFFYEKFYEIHDERMNQGKFIGKDQTIMNLFARTHANHTCKLWPGELLNKCRSASNIWFTYQDYFSAYGRYWKRTQGSNRLNRSRDAIDASSKLLSSLSKESCQNEYGNYFSSENSVTCSGEGVGIPRCYEC